MTFYFDSCYSYFAVEVDIKFLGDSTMHVTRKFIVDMFKGSPLANREIFQMIRSNQYCIFERRWIDFGYSRGSGNSSQRRRGIDTAPQACGCTVCVVYGGDCANSLRSEYVGEHHRSQRGVKTKLSRVSPWRKG